MSNKERKRKNHDENVENILHSTQKNQKDKSRISTPLKSVDLNLCKPVTSLSSLSNKFNLESNLVKAEPKIEQKYSIVDDFFEIPTTSKINAAEFKPEKRKQSSDQDDENEDEDQITFKKKKKKALVLSSNENSEVEDEIVVLDSEEEKSTDINNNKRKRRIKIQNSDDENEEKSDSEDSRKLRRSTRLQKVSNKAKDIDYEIEEEEEEDDDDEEFEYDEDDNEEAVETRRRLREIIDDQDLDPQTRRALRDEKERRKRLEQKKSKAEDETVKEEFFLDKEPKSGEPILKVHNSIVKKMKPHQIEGVKFMWDSCYETITRVDNNMKGSGCILAHCMGLGKTLQIIGLIHTLLSNRERTKCNKILILLPKNVLTNWKDEIEKWTEKCKFKIPVYQLKDDGSDLSKEKYKQRLNTIEEWFNDHGVFLLSYHMYKFLVTGKFVKNSDHIQRFKNCLSKPGPDLIICDEGHTLKNSKTDLAQSFKNLETKRRIVLTGTPLQNNLIEYHCMVSFVSPNLLGTLGEFRNGFDNPIRNGQHKDSTREDVIMMKKRAHVLHQRLEGIVNRKDFSVIRSFLPPKNEYVLSIRLSDFQIELYRTYLAKIRRIQLPDAADLDKIESATLFKDYHILAKIWTHPWLLKIAEEEENKRDKKIADKLADKKFINDDDDEEDDEKSAKKSKKKSSKSINLDKLYFQDEIAKNRKEKWYKDMFPSECEFDPSISGKLTIFAQLLRLCMEKGEKLVVFSQSLTSLDMIEEYLYTCSESFDETWEIKKDYYRIDGHVSSLNRQSYIDAYNAPHNKRGRLFLLSTKAGGVGINLHAANRCIIFDSTWNPSHDTQSIYRIYRLGQEKEVFIYRFLAQGTMEEKIYMRQVTKNALSQRVVDEHQLDRHYTSEELRELYSFYPDVYLGENDSYLIPKDDILKRLLLANKNWIKTYHEHDSLLENRIEEGLTLEEQRAAWAEYEAESKAKVQAQAQAQASAQLLHDELIRNTAANFADENSNDSTQSEIDGGNDFATSYLNNFGYKII